MLASPVIRSCLFALALCVESFNLLLQPFGSSFGGHRAFESDIADRLRNQETAFDVADNCALSGIIIGSEEPALHGVEAVTDL